MTGVLIEPSGIFFDVDEFFDVLCEEPLDRWYEIGNVIAIVDARLEENLSEKPIICWPQKWQMPEWLFLVRARRLQMRIGKEMQHI